MPISKSSILITSTIDSADGFEHAEAHPYARLFRDFGAERRRVVEDLQQVVRSLGGTPNDDGSLSANLHRRWLNLRGARGMAATGRSLRRSIGARII